VIIFHRAGFSPPYKYKGNIKIHGDFLSSSSFLGWKIILHRAGISSPYICRGIKIQAGEVTK
jgi:hypothetical protein